MAADPGSHRPYCCLAGRCVRRPAVSPSLTPGAFHRGAKPPDWSRDELILTLNLYMMGGRKELPANDPSIVALSDLLNRLPIHPASSRGPDFRNPHGVSMELGHFLAVAPNYKG